MSTIEFNTYITDAEDIFNRIWNKKVGNVIGSIIDDHVLSFDDIERLEKILEMKNLSQ